MKLVKHWFDELGESLLQKSNQVSHFSKVHNKKFTIYEELFALID